jgi:hypothetical protein
MKPRVLLITSFICLALLLTPSFSWEATDISAMNLRKMRNIYGFYIARFYQTVKGLPLIDLESKDKLVIAYRREDSACNEIFLRENPDMAEDCKKVREELTFVNKHRNIVRVHIKGGKILSTKITTSFDEKRLVKNRAVILLHDALIVHDSVMDRYSRNLAKIYHFPGVKPRVETDKPILRQNGTRAMPDISYLGKRPHMVAVNWSYPPLSGHFTLYRGSKRIGKIPTALLYKPLKNGRAQALFEDEGLLNYLKRKYEDGSLKNRYGIAIHKFVGTLIETQDS